MFISPAIKKVLLSYLIQQAYVQDYLETQLWERGGSFILQNCDGEQPQY